MRISLFGMLLLVLTACYKEKKSGNDPAVPTPMTDSKGWKLVKHSPEFYTLSAGTKTLDLVKEHSNGIDILYSSIFAFQDLQKINVRWRAYHDKAHDVKKVVVTSYSLDYLNRPVASKLLDVYSAGMGENELFAVNEQKIEPGAGRLLFEYYYYNVRSFSSNIGNIAPHESTTNSNGGIGGANPKFPFSNNGLLIKQYNNPTPIYNYSATLLGAAPKGDELLMFGKGAGNAAVVFESTNKKVTQVISAKNEIVRPTVTRTVVDLSKITQTATQNNVLVSRFFSDNQYLYVFLGLQNKKHRFFRISINDYTVSSLNESMYEQIDLDGFKNIILLNDRPGEILSMEKDGIYHIANNRKTFIASPSIKVGSSGTTVYYSNGKIWQVLFDENGSYLISRAI